MSLSITPDISRTVVAVRYVQETKNKPNWENDASVRIEQVATDSATLGLSAKAYHYFTNVPVVPGDYVLIRGGDYLHLGVIDSEVSNGDVRATREIIAKIDFGPALAKRRAEKERAEKLKELKRLIEVERDKEDALHLAEKYQQINPAIAALYAELAKEDKND